MSMYNLLEYSSNCCMTSGGWWNYYKEEVDDVDDNAAEGKSFKYKKNASTTSTTWISRTGRPTSTTTSFIIKRRIQYSTYMFLEINQFLEIF